MPTTLDDYIARREPAYKWNVVSKPTGKSGLYELRLTSQTWHDITWSHRVQVFVPEKIEFPGKALLSVSFGSGSDPETFFGQVVANQTGAVFVNVFNVPNQPLFDAREDALIALTFDKALQTGDMTWPLLLPMTKSVTQTMNAVEEFSKSLETPINTFAITGASKRGWTSYLVGAADAKTNPKRVVGLAPFVYDNLNIPAQLSHQLETWGEFSPRIIDYTERDLPRKMISPEGQKLVSIVDPFTYRDRLTMPTLSVNASNDEYWNLDAFDFYGDKLPGEVARFEAVNVGHFMSGEEIRAAGTMGAWFRRVARGQKLPSVTLTRDGANVSVSSAEAGQVRLLVARSASRDFRRSRWTVLSPRGGGVANGTPNASTVNTFALPTAPADQPFTAIFAEVEFADEPLPLILSTPVQIIAPELVTRASLR